MARLAINLKSQLENPLFLDNEYFVNFIFLFLVSSLNIFRANICSTSLDFESFSYFVP